MEVLWLTPDSPEQALRHPIAHNIVLGSGPGGQY
jgi:hypothetical protein